ncbi:unnamed protein product [Taenia asiatica]|uniref:TSNAXIP1_N domain-containing protein n=1 Tax=Taenia asiatica TaxID=60517 RepID=A0A0R3WER6_TAEAS|nr:unnamed protein product [Taenia asiatica]
MRDTKKLGISEETSDPLRLQLYREIFDRFIEECAYYAPILAKIKDQYEGFIMHLRKKINEMQPIKELLWVASFDADKRVNEFQNRENTEIDLLKSERNRDKFKLDKMKQECVELQVTVSKLMEQLRAREETCNLEADGRKMLVTEVNDINSRLRELEALTRADMERNTDDPIKLKILVGEYEKALERANTELNTYRSDFEERVPRVKYDETKKQLEAKTREVDSLNEELESAASRYSLLKDHCETLNTWRDLYNTQILYITRVLSAK